MVTRGTKEKHTQKLESVLTKLENEGYKASKKKSKFYLKRDNLAGLHYCPGWSKTEQRKDGSHKQTKPTNQHKNTQIFFGGDPILCKIHSKLIRKNRQYETITQEKHEMGVDRRTKHRFQQYQERTNSTTMPRTLQREQKKYCHHRRLRHRSWNSIMAETKQWRPKANSFRHPIP